MSPCFGSQASYKAEMKPPGSIIKLYEQQSSNKGRMTIGEFIKFLTEYQGENETDAKEISKKYGEGPQLDDFFRYLREDSKPPLRKVDQDVDDAPLAHYFTFTEVKISLQKTHKRKLIENYSQKIKMLIAEALKSGVRVIQLDLSTSQKNGSDTTQKEVLFSKALGECLETIKQEAFQTNDYPVIVTFEGTLESSLQSKIVRIAKIILAGYWEDMDLKTSLLKDLKRKILMPQLSKRISETQEEERVKKVEASTESGPSGCKIESLESAKLKDGLDRILTTNSDDIKWYKITHPDLEKATKHHAVDLVKYTQKNLLMVDPKEKNTGRSNINPMTGWIHGAQMVAVNTKGYDKHLWATHGLFRANGNHGYVKKPEILLNKVEVFDPDPATMPPLKTILKANGNHGYVKKPEILLNKVEVFDPDPATMPPLKTILKVKLYMGYGWNLDFSWIRFDTFSPPDFFVKVQILGVPADISKKKTKIISNEWNPAWDHEFEFEIKVPQLALLRVEVRDFDDEDVSAFWGQTCLPVWELKRGIRAVPLHNNRGAPYKSINLLMGFQFNYMN